MHRDGHALSPDLGERERAYVFSVAMKYVKDEDAAEDVTQDALLLAHKNRASFRGTSRYSTWLYRVAATTALMYLRKKRRRSRELLIAVRPDEDEPEIPFDPRDPAAGPEERVSARQELERVADRLDHLGEKYADVVRLRFLEGLTEPEIARLTGLNLSTVKTRSYRARTRLREGLDLAA